MKIQSLFFGNNGCRVIITNCTEKTREFFWNLHNNHLCTYDWQDKLFAGESESPRLICEFDNNCFSNEFLGLLLKEETHEVEILKDGELFRISPKGGHSEVSAGISHELKEAYDKGKITNIPLLRRCVISRELFKTLFN